MFDDSISILIKLSSDKLYFHFHSIISLFKAYFMDIDFTRAIMLRNQF